MIAGGEGKGQDFKPLAGAFRGKVRAAVLLGRDAPAIAAALEGVCRTETVARYAAAAMDAGVAMDPAVAMDAAVGAAHRIAVPGDTVLLSPACASFDMFRDYGHRGDEFAAAVLRLKGSSP
jgi:UDP-N-acetylmuramoylalanine--D-glutamate ligase